MNTISLSLKILLRRTVKAGLRLLCIFPVRKNRVLFSSYNHAVGYSCNPKYICEYLKRQYPGEYDLVWAYAEPEKWQVDGTISVRRKSLKWIYAQLTSGVIVYNVNIESYLPKRAEQLVINTWHAGGAYKRVGFENATLEKLDLWRTAQLSSRVDVFLSSSEAFTRSNIDAYHFKGRILNSGMPRNDLFFQPDTVAAVRKKVRSEYNAGEDSLVLLYAPTFRKNVMDPQARNVCFPDAAIQQALGDHNVRIWRREHPEDNNRYEKSAAVDVSGYPDMQELLCAADILVTDYSSSIWDFAILGRPCFLFVPDLADYVGEDRGFFTPIEQWPGMLCRSEEELVQALEKCARDEPPCSRRDFAARAADHLKSMGSYEDGHAAERVAALIRSWTTPDEKQN